ncbi:MAG: class I SAM-dependent methyltransferase [Sphaerochaetaceae bacterium]
MAKTEAFDKHSDVYDLWFDNNRLLYETELKAIKSLITEGEIGLEVGVGSGKFAFPLNIQYGVEPSDIMAEKASRLGIEVYKGVAENLPIESNRFDFVLMVTTICFVDDLEKAFKEAKRVLKNGGSIILGFVDLNSEIGQEYLKRKESSLFYSEATFYTTDEVLYSLSKVGFIESEVFQTLLHGSNKTTILPGHGQGSFVTIKSYKPK